MTHGRIICDQGHMLMQCKCADHKSITLVPHDEKCTGPDIDAVKPPLRKIEVHFSDEKLEAVNEMMRMFDVWRGGDGAVYTGIITTHSTLPIEEYQATIEPAFEQMGGKIYSVKEITDGKE